MTEIWMPPNISNFEGDPRRIGVEIEFAGLDVAVSAALIREVFGGRIEFESAHKLVVEDTAIGDFGVKLDAQLVHPDGDADEIEREARRVLGDLSSGLVPTEIVGPPAPIESLADFDTLVHRLRARGAQGTKDGLTYAFGLHLNPEAPSLAAGDVLRVMQAYMLLSPLLRRRIDVDALRRLLPYVDPFPLEYQMRILSAGYAPDMAGLIDDYIYDNPTRNRELDMLPMFAFVDESRVRRHIDDPLIKARPTYHYRLPNTDFGRPGWGVVREWNRWVMVERIAAADDRLGHLADEFRRRHPEDFLDRVSVRLREWFTGFSD